MARIRDIRLIPLAYRMPELRAYGMARSIISERGSCSDSEHEEVTSQFRH